MKTYEKFIEKDMGNHHDGSPIVEFSSDLMCKSACTTWTQLAQFTYKATLILTNEDGDSYTHTKEYLSIHTISLSKPLNKYFYI